jgi:amino acid transporter
MSGAPDSSNPTDAQQGQGAMTVRGAAFLGVGSMVGAGIFALLGEAGAVAGAAVWLSFLIAGIIATLQGYAVAKLGARYPSSGWHRDLPAAGLREGAYHRDHILAAVLRGVDRHRDGVSVVRNYGSAHFFGESSSPGWSKVLATAVVLAVAVVNIAGARFIDRVQPAIVIVLLAVFAIFIVVTLGQVDPQLLAPSTYPPAVDLISSVALTFFAYLGLL